jgi:hypothetical protein
LKELIFDEFYGDELEIVKNELEDSMILYLFIDNDSYHGNILLIYKKSNKLFFYEDSHCSCNGLDWYPEEVTIEEIKKYKYFEFKSHIYIEENFMKLIGGMMIANDIEAVFSNNDDDSTIDYSEIPETNEDFWKAPEEIR